jgi:hypothetical protein
VNVVEIPVYWEQVEPRQGALDFSLVDMIMAQARQHDVRLVLLWFGTWVSIAVIRTVLNCFPRREMKMKSGRPFQDAGRRKRCT